ncbi:PRC-barrel domain-containing protein [Thermanaeromonas sp. C210]|uniref:PRC-barrel domain-containing protein n=1 Tax=Thermanaeromonas sp. C210 TaxID=2731925 RepID=UPI001565D353|nr:PRC-barrel domain-containing protein [Thermanaeromonas sp. C210]
MPRGRELVGLPVVSLEAGEELGRVHDLVWDVATYGLSGVVLTSNGLRKGPRFLKAKKIRNPGPQALTVDSSACLEDTVPGESLRWREFKGRRVLDAGGRELGLLEDVEVEWPSGRIVALELSQGLVNDLLEGRRTIDAAGCSITWGPDVVILHTGGGV